MNSVVKVYARQYTYPFLRDGGSAWNLYRMNGYIPLNYVIDTAGIVVGSMEGFNETTIRAWIEASLPPVGMAEEKTRPVLGFASVRPNPAAQLQTVVFNMPAGGSATVRVYSSTGALVKTLVNGAVPAGRNTATWDLTDNFGRAVPNGLYFYELAAGGQSARLKVSVVR